jgi:outer membrane receptor protein involved in Fe transport
MMKKINFLVKSLVIINLLCSTTLAQSGSIRGFIKDRQTSEPLPYSNAILIGTSLGSAADQDGKYYIKSIPPGKYVLRASFLGYKQEEVNVNVLGNQTIEVNISLVPESVLGDTVIVTAQAEGQLKAINEQLASIQIKNVVSAARIQELPDANAAESVSRLPGVSLIRTGGEGSKVVIRGLSPQYNQITIDGVELPSNVASANNMISNDKALQDGVSNIGDRASDLSMISSNMLGGIEVIKAITPDMDATLIGGVVNFGLRKASRSVLKTNLDAHWLPMIQITSQGGHNALKDEYKDYKLSGSIEKRFFDESFGTFFMGSVERRNLSNNELGAYYELKDKDRGDAGIPELISLNLNDVYRTRKRNGFTAVFDYGHSTGEISLMNIFSSSDTRATHRTQGINQFLNDLVYSCSDIHEKMNVISNLLIIKQDIPLFHVDLKFSHSYTEKRNPEDLYFDFIQEDAGLQNKGDLSRVHPSYLALMAVPNFNNAGQITLTTSETFQEERILNGSLDLETSISFSNWLSSRIKFGGNYNRRNRTNDFNYSSGSQGYAGGANILTAWQQAYPDLQLAGGRVGLINFLDSSYSYGEFLNGDYKITYPISPDFMWKLLPIAKRTSSLEGYRRSRLGSDMNDYSGHETKSAGYLMATINMSNMITIIPGFRYQNLTREYTALQQIEGEMGEYSGGFVTKARSHGFFLPMLHLRYKPLNWFQMHFAYTNSLNYPDYGIITPRFYVGKGFVNYNNVDLKPATSENFDLVATIFMNEVGLFNINGFKKRITDLIFPTHTFLTDLSKYPELPQDRNQLWEFNTYINNPIKIDLYGIETEWQTNFWYLPQPFNGLVFNINYTHIISEAGYPKSIYLAEYDEFGNLKTTIIDTFYTNRLLNQPNDIINMSLGYDYGGFSARVSMLLQDNIFKRPDFWMQNRVISDKFTRFDLSVKQMLPWFGIQIFFNVNNITGEDDVDINQKNYFPASEQRYGMSADAGITIKI